MKYSAEQMKQALKDGKCFWFYHVNNNQTLYKAKLKGDRISVIWDKGETSYSFLPEPTCLEHWICTKIEGEETVTNKPHKHAELIKKWADTGCQIQYKYPDCETWHNCNNNRPYWELDNEYRVKPSLVKKWNWVCKDVYGDMYVTSERYSEEEIINIVGNRVIQKIDSTMIEVEE